MNELYVVLGDVVQSREIEDREAFQHELTAACTALNEQYAEAVYAEFTLQKGVDELGGVLMSANNIYEIVRELYMRLHPYEVRLAVVRGDVDVGVETRDVSRMDGQAFHDADERVTALEETELLFDMETGRGALDVAVTDEINLLLLMRRGWTDRQREAVDAYRRHGTQQAAADELGVTQQAVSNALDRAAWSEIGAVEERLLQTLQEYEK